MNKQLIFSCMSITLLAHNAYGMNADTHPPATFADARWQQERKQAEQLAKVKEEEQLQLAELKQFERNVNLDGLKDSLKDQEFIKSLNADAIAEARWQQEQNAQTDRRYQLGRKLELLKTVPLNHVVIINFDPESTLTPVTKQFILSSLRAADDAVTIDETDRKNPKVIIDYAQTFLQYQPEHSSSEEEELSQSQEESGQAQSPTTRPHLSIGSDNESSDEEKSSTKKALVAEALKLHRKYELLNEEDSLCDHIDLVGYPKELEAKIQAHKLDIVKSLASVDDALTIDETDPNKPRLVIDLSEIFSYPLDCCFDYESTTDRANATRGHKHTLLRELNTNLIEIVGYPEHPNAQMQEKKLAILRSLASVDDALSIDESTNRLVIDISKILSFPLDATAEEIRLKQLLTLKDEEIVLVKDDIHFNATTDQKTNARKHITSVLQAIVSHDNGSVAIDVAKLQQATLAMAPKPVQEKPSLTERLLIPTVKGAALVGLGYLLATYGTGTGK